MAADLTPEFYESIQQKNHWRYLADFKISSTSESESELPVFKYLHSHTFSDLNYARGDVSGSDISDHDKFRDNAEKEPVPIKVELTLMSKLFKILIKNKLIPDCDLKAKVRAFERAAE